MGFALRAARLFDGHRLVDPPIVTIEGTTFAAVGEQTRGAVDEATVVDLGDATLLPGLVDCHQHLCFDGNGTLEEQVSSVSDGELADRARRNARRALHAGVTTIRDLGDRGWVTLALRSEPDLPTILAAGPPLTALGGHCWFLGGECADGPALLEAVRERRARGSDLVKLMVTGGSGTPAHPPWCNQFTADEVRAAVDEAHALGLPVAAHCHGLDGIAAAVAAGVDTIEHCTFLATTGRAEPDDGVIDAIAAAGITVSATLGRDPAVAAPPFAAQNLAPMLDGLASLRTRGGAIVVGTDAGITPGKPHDILPFAAEPLARIGITGLELLHTLTAAAADACRVGGRKGTLRPGADADVLAVRGDPATDPAALRAVEGVWRAGTRVR